MHIITVYSILLVARLYLIDFEQETKYVMSNSELKTSVDVSRQTRNFYAQTNML